MESKLEYSFDDEPITKFCYDSVNKRLDIHFDGYFDKNQNIFVDRPCTWVIYDWEDGRCKVGDNAKIYILDDCIGVFSLILYAKYNNDELEMLVMTLDNRYVTYLFKAPKLLLNRSDDDT